MKANIYQKILYGIAGFLLGFILAINVISLGWMSLAAVSGGAQAIWFNLFGG